MNVGDRLGRYELVGLLGAGGAGRVFDAVLHGPAGFRKPVALKVLHEAGTGLIREARLGGMLQHPNLVEVYALEEAEGCWVCAMEKLEAGSLRQYLPLPPRAVVDVGIDVCAALTYVHGELGLVHLDLKPENLLLEGSTVKLADLGIARRPGMGDGRVRGTPGYMSPEQAAGVAVDARSDVWSLGVVLQELATGIRSSDLQGVSWLDPVLERCFAPDPNDRFRNPAAMSAALEQLDPPGDSLAGILGEPELGTNRRSTMASLDLENMTLDSFTEEVEHSLPEELDTFVGRATELGVLLDALSSPGLVVLRGTGGVGKTRLALHGAHVARDRWDLPGWFCALEDVRTAQDLLVAVSSTLGLDLRGSDSEEAIRTVGFALEARGASVMILDNVEQLDGVAHVVGRWVLLAPELRLLLTSRRSLDVEGERELVLEPMGDSDAVELLVVRGRDHGVVVEQDDVLAELSRRLDGIPLALELAAARLPHLPASAILERLDARFRLLRSGRRGVGQRQSTLRGTLDWSWDLLDPVERLALAQCAVFEGGFTLEAADEVLALNSLRWSLDVVEALLDRSLVTRRGDRLMLYESVRAYAREKLADPEVWARHGRAFATWGSPASLRQVRSGAADAFHGVIPELPNLLSAARRAAERGDLEVLVPCCQVLTEVLAVRGPLATARSLLEEVIGAAPTGSRARTRLEVCLGRVLHRSGALTEAAERLEAAAALVDVLEPPEVAGVRAILASVWMQQGDLERAEAAYRESIELHGALGDVHQVARSRGNLGILHNVRGQREEAVAEMQAALKTHRKTGNRRSEGLLLGNLAVVLKQWGRRTEALAAYQQALAIQREVGDRRSEGVNLGNMAALLSTLGDQRAAEDAYRRSSRLNREVGSRREELLNQGNLGNLLAGTDRYEEALAVFDAVIPEIEALGDLPRASAIRGFRGDLYRRMGLLQPALIDLKRAIDGLGLHFPGASLRYRIAEGEVMDRLGDPTGLPRIEESLRDATRRGLVLECAFAQAALARVWIQRGDRDRAMVHLEQGTRQAEEGGASDTSAVQRELGEVRLALSTRG